MPSHYPDYPSHSQVLSYFESYAEQFGLKKYIRFNTKVDKVTRSKDGKWELFVNRAEVPELFDFYWSATDIILYHDILLLMVALQENIFIHMTLSQVFDSLEKSARHRWWQFSM